MVSLKQLKERHPEHIKKSEYWDTLTCLVKGADEVTDEIKKILLPNPDHRSSDVMTERIKLATYVSKITPIISRFNAELFANPVLPTGSTDKFWTDIFFSNGALLDDDDDGRSSFISFCQRAMFSALTTGKAIALVDTRRSDGATREAQKAQGALDPYVLLFPRSALWDWKAGIEGFEYAKIHQFTINRDRWFTTPYPQHIFTIYERTENQILAYKYIVTRKLNEGDNPANISQEPFIDLVTSEEMVNIETVIEGEPIYNATGVYEFPVVTLTLPKPLHMAGQLFELQKSYFRQNAAIEYALYTGNYGILLAKSMDDEDFLANTKVGEGYYLHLPNGADLRWLERGNSSVSTSINFKAEIKRDIYDMLQQIAMSAADGTSIIARSGESKREDRRPEALLLGTFGGILKDFMIQIMKVASIAHNEPDKQWSVTGYSDFIGSNFMDSIQDWMGIKGADIQSPTFNREAQKYLVHSLSKEMELDNKVIEQVIGEIDKAPDSKFLPQELDQNPQGGEQTPSGQTENKQ